MKSYIAINSYRNSTDNGFANTWVVYRCTREQQRRLLTEGLPTAVSSEKTTMGIRLATPSERAWAIRNDGKVAQWED